MDKFSKLAKRFFSIAPEDLKDELSSKDIPDWDSMNYLLFIAALEREYAMSFSMDEVMQAQSIGDIKKAIISKGITL